MIGVLVTVLVQSSSTSTSIIVSLVGAAGHLHVLALAMFTVAQLNWTPVRDFCRVLSAGFNY